MRAVLIATGFVLLGVAAPAHAAFPGANGKIVFERTCGDPGCTPYRDIYAINPDGTGLTNLTGATPTTDDRQPAWSPDGQKIAFSSAGRDSSGLDIYVMNADGTGVGRVTSFLGSDTCPFGAAWSPAGLEIAFWTSCLTGNRDVYTINVDGSGLTNVTSSPGEQDSPAWSPDGKRIAFVSSEIYTMNPDGTGITRLTFSPSGTRNRSPDWSPDGSRIVFSSTRDAPDPASSLSDDIYVMKSDGSDLTRLTNTPSEDGAPSWSPDGMKIVFVTCVTSDCSLIKLRTMNADGTGSSDLTNGLSKDVDPDWQPIPIKTYPRPRGAGPMRISLVPAYPPCTSPNTTHGGPLAYPSCASPQITSQYLTVGTPDANGKRTTMEASILLRVVVGASADVKIDTHLNNVFNKDLTDYTGGLRAHLPLQITDKNNTPSPGGPGAATTEQVAFDFDLACAATTDTTIGSDCPLATSANALVPGSVTAGLRAIWQVGQAQVYDGGTDGNANTASDNTLYLDQGIFVP